MMSTHLFMAVAVVLVVGALAAPEKSYIRIPRKIYTDEEVETIFSRKQYCGDALDEKLQVLCGMMYNRRRAGRSVREATYELDVNNAMPVDGATRNRRGIVEECCHRGCADSELQLYCLSDATTTAAVPVMEPAPEVPAPEVPAPEATR